MPVVKTIECGGSWVSVLRVGTVKMDGGAIFGVVPKPLWEQKIPADDRNRVQLALNCLLVQTPSECVLVETGFGGKVNERMRDIYDLDERNGLVDSLGELGVLPDMVTRVVLTHLHQDHAGGCTVMGENGLEPLFKNAKYYVQDGEWLDAELADGQTVNGYLVEDVMRPIAQSVVRLHGDAEICDGVRVVLTPGHTRCHQSVVVVCGKKKFCYIGDLIPTTHHLKPIYLLAYDLYPRETYKNKQSLLARAHKEGWVMVWSHDVEVPLSRVVTDVKGNWIPEGFGSDGGGSK